MSESFESFKSLVANDAKLSARWEAVVAEVSARIGAEYDGAAVEREALIAMPSVRLAVLTDDALSDRWVDEAKKLTAVAKVLRDREVSAAFEEAKASEAASSEYLPASAYAASRALNEARRAGRAAPEAKKAGPRSAEEEGRALARVLSQPTPAMKMAAARREGFVK